MPLQLKPPKDGVRYRVLSYQRVSRDHNETGSHTFETQTMRIRERLDQLRGSWEYELVELQDDGVSGVYGPVPTRLERRTRPALKQVIAALETGEFDVFVVYSFSRFARSPRWFHQILDDAILGTKTSFVSVTEPWDLSDPSERMMAGMQALFDGHYRDAVSKRNRDAALTRAQHGYALGDVGYGWQWEPRADVPPGGRRRIFPVPEAGRWVVWMKDRYLEGAALGKIAAGLNELGVPTASGKAKWQFGTVQKVLWNPLHAGLVPSSLGPLKGEHYERRYWDPEVREQLLEACASRKKWAKTNSVKETSHLLHGLLRCARCGHRLYLSGQDPARKYYACRTGLNQGKFTCPLLRAPEALVDEAVVKQIAGVAREPQMQALLVAEAARAADQQDDTLRAEAAQLRSTIGSVQERRDGLLEALARKTITDDRYREYEPKLLAERATAQQRLAQIEAQLQSRERREAWAATLKETILRFPVVWNHLEWHERRETLSLLLETLTLDRHDRTVTLRLKVPLLPEQEITLDLGRRYRAKKKRQSGVLSLTMRELAALHWVDEGKNWHEISELMGVSYLTVRHWLYLAKKKLGTQVLADAVTQARAQIRVMLPKLPLRHLNAPQYDEDGIRPSAKLLQLLPLFASGANNREVARETGLRESTVSGRRQALRQLLRARTTFEMVQKARKLGLL